MVQLWPRVYSTIRTMLVTKHVSSIHLAFWPSFQTLFIFDTEFMYRRSDVIPLAVVATTTLTGFTLLLIEDIWRKLSSFLHMTKLNYAGHIILTWMKFQWVVGIGYLRALLLKLKRDFKLVWRLETSETFEEDDLKISTANVYSAIFLSTRDHHWLAIAFWNDPNHA